MDDRLYIAACTGNIDALKELLNEDPIILQNASLTAPNTPLHVAALLGHTEFAKVVLAQHFELARELNHQGLGPIHLASSKGYIEIVKILLLIDPRLYVHKDRDGRTPLHWAAFKGRLDVLGELLACCPESAREMTHKTESVVHLAVKSNQCEVVVWLILKLGELNFVDEIINTKDYDGNTVLHLATARKQYQTVKTLLRDTKVDINATNSKGLTALDISSMSFSESDDMVIREMLRHAQGTRASNQQNPPTSEAQIEIPDSSNDLLQRQTSRNEFRAEPRSSPRENREPKMTLESVKNGIIVLAVMFATLTFEAAVNPPGGLWQDWQPNNVTNPQEARNSKDITHSPIFQISNALSKMFLLGPIPYLNVTSPDLYEPGKAINAVLARNHFVNFLYHDTVCFTLSLATIFLVMFTSAFDHVQSAAVFLMTVLLLVSAGFLYHSTVSLVTNKHFAEWVIKIALSHLLMVGFVMGLIVAFVDDLVSRG